MAPSEDEIAARADRSRLRASAARCGDSGRRSRRASQTRGDPENRRRNRPCGAELGGELEQYQDSYRLCYLSGPAGIIVALAGRIS